MGKHLYKIGKRKCFRCKRILLLNPKYFYRNKGGVLGFRQDCKECFNKLEEDTFSVYKYTARKRNLYFHLTRKEFNILVFSPCYYCGDKGKKENGVDRVNNDNGYIASNCVSCCKLCNRMKWTHSKEVFIQQCLKVSSLWRKS